VASPFSESENNGPSERFRRVPSYDISPIGREIESTRSINVLKMIRNPFVKFSGRKKKKGKEEGNERRVRGDVQLAKSTYWAGLGGSHIKSPLQTRNE
jgi:hypothetical protein